MKKLFVSLFVVLQKIIIEVSIDLWDTLKRLFKI